MPGPNPGTVPAEKDQGSRSSLSPKQHRTKTSRRLSGLLSTDGPPPPSLSISSLSSIGSSSRLDPSDVEKTTHDSKARRHLRHQRANHIVSQVAEWLHAEKAKKSAHKARRHKGHAKLSHAADATKNLVDHVRSDETKHHKKHRTRADSDLSDESLALEKLDEILSRNLSLDDDGLATPTEPRKEPYLPRRASRSKPTRQGSKVLLRKGSTLAPSDTEYQEPDIDVPSAEVTLDNSKTLGYSGGNASSEVDLTSPKKKPTKEKDAWLQFKHEIVRLAHTLRLKGWRRLPLELSGDIDVERLSGALTNAVYVVSPPSNLLKTPAISKESTTSLVPKKPPP